MCAGAANTTVYPQTNAEESAFILSDSGSKVLIAEDAAQLAKAREKKRRAARADPCRRHRPRGRGPLGGLGAHPRRAGEARCRVPGEEPRPDQGEGRRDHQGPARDPHLHLGHHRPPQGCPPAARQLGVHGEGHRRDRSARAGGRAVPVAAARARLRQGAHLAGRSRSGTSPPSTAGSTRSSRICRSCSRRTWPPCRASSRRSTTASRPRRARVAGAKYKIFQWAAEVAREYAKVSQDNFRRTGTASVPFGLERQAQGRRRARLRQDPRGVRRQPARLCLRLGRARARDRLLLRRRRHPHPGGLRPHRVLRRLLRQPGRGLPHGHGRQAAARHGGAHRGRRRDPAARPRHHGGLPRAAREDRRGPGGRRLVPHR